MKVVSSSFPLLCAQSGRCSSEWTWSRPPPTSCSLGAPGPPSAWWTPGQSPGHLVIIRSYLPRPSLWFRPVFPWSPKYRPWNIVRRESLEQAKCSPGGRPDWPLPTLTSPRSLVWWRANLSGWRWSAGWNCSSLLLRQLSTFQTYNLSRRGRPRLI